MSVTMEDIARTAGVARSTVSRALADNHRVKLETRLRIQQIALEMGYLPNTIARGLTTKQTYNLGVLLFDIAEAFIAELVKYIDQVVRRFHYGLILTQYGNDLENVKGQINSLLQRQVDAIIVTDRVMTDNYQPLLHESHVPIIVINRREQEYPVSTDNIEAAQRAVDYLLELGHRRVVYVGSSRAAVESKERQTGYELALQHRGISPDPSLVIIPASWSAPEAGAQAVEQILQISPPITAILCYNDMTAIGAIAKIFAAGLNVPQDISVVGFDDISLASHTVPALTTMAQQRERIAELAVETALALRAGKQPVQRELLSCELVLRDSTAPPGNRF